MLWERLDTELQCYNYARVLLTDTKKSRCGGLSMLRHRSLSPKWVPVREGGWGGRALTQYKAIAPYVRPPWIYKTLLLSIKIVFSCIYNPVPYLTNEKNVFKVNVLMSCCIVSSSDIKKRQKTKTCQYLEFSIMILLLYKLQHHNYICIFSYFYYFPGIF